MSSLVPTADMMELDREGIFRMTKVIGRCDKHGVALGACSCGRGKVDKKVTDEELKDVADVLRLVLGSSEEVSIEEGGLITIKGKTEDEKS